MTGKIHDIHPSNHAAAPPRRLAISLRRALTPSTPREHRFAHAITWSIVALFLLLGTLWSFSAGMNLRQQVWQSTRTIRFGYDIANGFRRGRSVLHDAEDQLHLDRATAPARLTLPDVAHGIVHYVDAVVADNPNGDYDVDYPPLRLAVMALWVRHVQTLDPRITHYLQQPGQDGPNRQPEDIAAPLLLANALCDAAAALAMFLLVWLWVSRGLRPAPPSLSRRCWPGCTREPPPAAAPKTIPPSTPCPWTPPHGLLLFLVVTAGFWYAFVAVAVPPPRPAPAVSVFEIHPHQHHATIDLVLNAENSATRCRVQWGPNIFYPHTTQARYTPASSNDQNFSVNLDPLRPGQTIHFRVSANNDNGTTNTDDFSFINQGHTLYLNTPPAGGIFWPSWTVWLRLFILFIVMVAAARSLPPIHRGWACGAVAAMLLWFDPLTILVSHVWPQWDVWILPIFLFAALLASLDCWLTAGLLIGVGCMFKGQLLLGAPILILWPLFAGRFGAALRILTGIALAAEIIVWPWMVRSAPAIVWLQFVMAAAAVVLIASFLQPMLRRTIQIRILAPIARAFSTKPQPQSVLLPAAPQSPLALFAPPLLAALALAIAIILFLHPLPHAPILPGHLQALLLLLIVISPWFLPRRSLIFWLAATFVAAVWISSLIFPSSYSWLAMGFAYGSTKQDHMQMSVGSFSNLASILSQYFNSDLHDTLGSFRFTLSTPGAWHFIRWFSIPSIRWRWSTDLEVKTSLALLYAACLLLASFAAALHARRRDPRFLVALVVPWLIFPLVMCQMGARYLLWSSAISAAMIAVSTGLTLLHVLLALLAAGMLARQLLAFDPQRWPQLYNFFTPTYPGLAWMLLLIAVIFLFASLTPTRRRV